MRTPAQWLLAYAAILGTVIAGIHHIAWWGAVAGGSVLALISISNHAVAYRALGGGGESTYTMLYFSSALNAAAVSAAALVLGNALAWILGI
jgi:hypothetical protein